MTTETYDPTNPDHVMQLARWLDEAKFADSRAERAIEVIVNTIERNAMLQAMDAAPDEVRYIQGLRKGALGVLAHLAEIRRKAQEIVDTPLSAEAEEKAAAKVRQMALGGGTTV